MAVYDGVMCGFDHILAGGVYGLTRLTEATGRLQSTIWAELQGSIPELTGLLVRKVDGELLEQRHTSQFTLRIRRSSKYHSRGLGLGLT